LTPLVLDEGSDWFQPSNLEITDLEVGNRATNVIPGAKRARAFRSATTITTPAGAGATA
jgi:hypothetical protein